MFALGDAINAKVFWREDW